METAAAIIGIARVTTTVSLQARRLCELWKDAPRDIYHLCDELETAKTFFGTLQSGIIDSPLTDDPSRAVLRQELNVLLRRANSILGSLEPILARLVSGGNDSPGAPDAGGRSGLVLTLAKRRKFLWLRRVNKVTKLRGMLRRTTDDIGQYLILLNIQVSMTLMNGKTILEDSASSTAIDQAADVDQLSREEACVERAVELARLDVENKLLTMASKVDRLEKDLHEVRAGTALTGLAGRLPTSSALSDTGDPWPGALSRTIHHLPMPSSSPCGRGCRCQCHSAKSRSYVRWEFSGLQHALGSISITFLGSRESTRTPEVTCTDTGCHDSQRYAWKIRYSFPRWLARSVVSACFSWHPDTPELLIRVHQVLSPGNASYYQTIFGRIVNRDDEGLKATIAGRPSSVSDIWAGSRGASMYESPLHRAVDFQNISTVQILIQAGADISQEDHSGVTPVWRAFKHFLVRGSTTARQIIAEMGSLSSFCEEADFTNLHRVLLGVLPISLATALANPSMKAQINDKDSVLQTTALQIAAARGTIDDVQALLAAGAEVNAADKGGFTPLLWACIGGRKDVARLLLEAGASVSCSTAQGTGVLHAAVFLEYCPTLIDMLLDQGVDIDAVNMVGDTALAITTQNPDQRPIRPLRHLIARGAMLDTRDRGGDTPLLNAVRYCCSPEVVETLVTCGADYTTINNNGESILHYLARFGHREAMRVFSKARMRGLVREMKDTEGKTPLEALYTRKDFSQELEVAFQQVLSSLDNSSTPVNDNTAEESEDNDEEESFHDALESMHGTEYLGR
ncbi:ankyrin repeat-containing domain protein [Echria macrotheca]|uniref:Ankyrin repeat-containing domain protein n=1 Tax=Echria macrotheca TaxID=438768 RepID=A0AAJ0BIW4_9PEZI|nr:ankyrin repeat-containing domain protein [Echria macrotheca]